MTARRPLFDVPRAEERRRKAIRRRWAGWARHRSTWDGHPTRPWGGAIRDPLVQWIGDLRRARAAVLRASVPGAFWLDRVEGAAHARAALAVARAQRAQGLGRSLP